jgi:hypothetical protein
MATQDQINQVRRLSDYFDADPYDDTNLSTMIDTDGVYRVVARMWDEKAAALSKLVDVSESGSSRQLGDSYKNALSMGKHFRELGESSEAPVDTTRFARTRAAVREG